MKSVEVVLGLLASYLGYTPPLPLLFHITTLKEDIFEGEKTKQNEARGKCHLFSGRIFRSFQITT